VAESEIENLRKEYPVWISLPILWGDQDAFGHVNNTVYIRWFESCRIVYGERAGFDESAGGRDIGPILAAVSCHYRKQLTYPDTVHIGARVPKIGNSSLRMEHVIISERLQAVAALGDSTIVSFDYTAQKPIAVSAEIRAKVEQIEGHPL
jgi:acyl-CoA thioester hydrolase